MSKFKVGFQIGDVCVFAPGAKYFGTDVSGIECTVNAGLEMRYMWPPGEDRLCYEVTSPQVARLPVLAEPHELRLKRPPDKHEPITDFTPCDPAFLEDLKQMRGKVGV